MMQMHLRVVVGFLLLLLCDRDDDYDGDEEKDNDRDDSSFYLFIPYQSIITHYYQHPPSQSRPSIPRDLIVG